MALFHKEAVKRWRRTVHKELRWLNLPSEDPVYRACMVLAAVYGFGTDVGALSEISGQAPEFVRGVLKRARQQRMLVGQTLRAGWEDKKQGSFAWFLDAMVAAGDLVRPVDPKRSAAHKGKHSGPRAAKRPRVSVAQGAIFSPKVTKSNPLYYIDEGSRPPSLPD